MLAQYLINAGLVTGPQPATANTSNSSMGASKTFLLGLKQFEGDESYLVFGRILHEHLQYIEDVNYHSKDFKLLNKEEQSWIMGMCAAARKNPIIKRLLVKSSRENKVYTEIDGIRVALILDLEQGHLSTGSDWKSTSCPSLSDFIKKALLYDYIRQGLLYKKARNLKHFYFIGIQKQPPHNVYIMDVKRHEAEEFYAKQELKFLLYFYKNYGKIVIPGKVSSPIQGTSTIKTENSMAIETKGKEALKAIADHHKKVKQSAKEHAKNVAQFNKMLSKFPKKEKELYAEKLAKFTIE